MDEITHLLDTHTVIWAYQDSALLGHEARKVISLASAFSLAVSDITLLEISMLVSKGRLSCKIPLLKFLQKIENDFVILPICSQESVSAMHLNLPQADPFDRVIVATAHSRQLTLLTKDAQIFSSGLVSVLW